MKPHILQCLRQSVELKETVIQSSLDLIIEGAESLAVCLASGHKILIFGNGGSAADAQHIAAEFVNRFTMERHPLAALALTTDTSVLTSIGNDYHFDQVFSKQVSALGQKDDIAWGISTSGNSKNVLFGFEAAKQKGLFTIAMTGHGGRLAQIADLVFRAPSDVTARIQETHITLAHILCDLVERILFPEKAV